MDIALAQALSRRRSVRAFAEHPIPLESLKKLLRAGQGKTGEGDKRTAPSAHALYPLRLHVVASRVDDLEGGLYAAEPAGLELKKISHADLRPALCKAAIGNPEWIANASCIIAICADMLTPARTFIEQSPYGARGERYVYLEAGAAAQNIQLQAVAEGLGSVLVGGFDDEATASVLGLSSPIAPIALMCLGVAAPES
ncbi:SagB/ThcOx family dehydrogenase [Martelella lutilitoris]|uniref:SagB/ThcOx family dehydrogenase n=1 Tax=Martelella lutilitoris TaxID=2583532 RepID=A0A5C4JU25_9HYPH|nr:SagB/ThcOx family dehydrogenase [Martelella lutilitoris]TNB48694.1 SagB/ThcOx family dehydrogenase [Martelella lutilitoris]